MYKIPAKTLFVGQSLVFMPQCHSTNDEASRLIQKGNVIEGTTIVTNQQTAGRGQRGNVWLSEAGKNLTFSIIFKPVFLAAKGQFYLNIAVSLGIYDYLSEMLENDVIKIKWPNDIMVNDKKVCGILIENQLSGQLIQHSIVGIGLNVNQEKFSIEKATSMQLITGKEFLLTDILENLSEKIESRYLMIRKQLFDEISKSFIKAMYWFGERHVFSTPAKQFSGMILGIDELGRLKIQADDGIRIFGVKEVEFLK